MKAYMVQSAKRIEPFGEHPGDCLIANRRLADLQEEALRNLGLQLVTVADGSLVQDPDEHIIFDDTLFFTTELLSEFVEGSRRLRSCTTCALKPGVSTLRSVVATQDVRTCPGGIEYGLLYMPRKELRGERQSLVIDPDQFFESVRFPAHMISSNEYLIPLTERVLVRIDHWVNLWAASICFLLAEGARLKKAPKIKLLGLALKARSTNQWRVLRTLNRVGRNCDIHPTAYIEGSTIGEKVKIGAGAIIRESLVGDGTYISNNATIELSVIGEGSTIHNSSAVQYSVLYPNANVGARFVSLALWGRDSLAGDGVTLADFRLDGESVRVFKDGCEVDTQNTFVGTCLGHRVYLGAGCVLAPGRTVPNDWRLAPKRTRVISACRPDGNVPGYRLIGGSRHGLPLEEVDTQGKEDYPFHTQAARH